MAENPDLQDESTASFLPFLGALRWVVDATPLDQPATRTLQQYQYSATDGGQDWYDIPVVSAADLPVASESRPKDYANESDAEPETATG